METEAAEASAAFSATSGAKRIQEAEGAVLEPAEDGSEEPCTSELLSSLHEVVTQEPMPFSAYVPL